MIIPQNEEKDAKLYMRTLDHKHGADIESIVTHLHHWVESSKQQVRLMGRLSATLSNDEDGTFYCFVNANSEQS
jgi:hypothetical protein